MKKSFTVFLVALSLGAHAQIDFFSVQEPKLKDYIIYRPFYNGVQFIEVNLNSYNAACVEYEDQVHPINNIRMVLLRPNPIILRNRQGVILKQYNLESSATSYYAESISAKGFVSTYFLPVDKSEKIAVPFNSSFNSLIFPPIEGDYANWRVDELDYKPSEKFKYVVSNDSLFGVVDTLGNSIIPIIYQDINYFNGCYEFKRHNKCGLFDSDGKIKIEAKYVSLNFINLKIRPQSVSFTKSNNDLLLVSNGKFGIIDYEGNVKLKLEYDEIVPTNFFYFFRKATPRDTFSGGQKFNSYGIIGLDFKTITEPRYFEFKPFTDHYYFVSELTGWGIIDSTGKEVSDFIFRTGELYPTQQRGYYTAYISDKPGYEKRVIVDSLFHPISSNYVNCEFIGNGFGSVAIYIGEGRNQKIKWGLINLKGELVVPCKYDKIRPYYLGLYTVELGTRQGLVNTKGVEVVPPIYENLNSKNDTLTARITSVRGENALGYYWTFTSDIYVLKKNGEAEKIESGKITQWGHGINGRK